MITKKHIDAKVAGYIKEHSSKYSDSSIKKALVTYGFDENYVEKRIGKHREKELMKKYLALALFMMFCSFSYFGISETKIFYGASITGLAVGENTHYNYFAIGIQKNGDDFYITHSNKISLVRIIGNENKGYAIRSFSENGLHIEDSFYEINEYGTSMIYVPVSAKSFEIHKENKVLFRHEFE